MQDATRQSDQGNSAKPSTARRAAAAGLIVFAVLAAAGAACAQMPQDWLVGLFGPPRVEARETYANKPDGPTFNHSQFDALLKAHVDDQGLVDYANLKRNQAALDAYIDALAKADYNALGRDEKLALLINAYNAFTLKLIVEHYPIKSIMDIPDSKRWDAVRWNVGGNTWSLNQIEHEQVRKHFKEPRIHWALVCAAIGCPPLRNEAFEASRLNEQLQAQSDYVHTHDRWLQLEGNQLKLTKLYEWYSDDFRQSAGSVIDYVAKQSPAVQQATQRGDLKVSYLEYDWSLNDQKANR